jgi:four helix bundle protein
MNEKNKEFKIRIYKYILRLIKFLVKLPKDPVIREITSQLTRSRTSIGANYFEALASSSKKEYINFFSYCLKSANESKFWLAVLKDGQLMPRELISECEYLLKETNEISNIFASSILTMKGKIFLIFDI